jgi:hypothetical protein
MVRTVESVRESGPPVEAGPHRCSLSVTTWLHLYTQIPFAASVMQPANGRKPESNLAPLDFNFGGEPFPFLSSHLVGTIKVESPPSLSKRSKALPGGWRKSEGSRGVAGSAESKRNQGFLRALRVAA